MRSSRGEPAPTVLERYGPAITQVLRRLDRATTVARKAVSLAEVADNGSRSTRPIGVGPGWEAAHRLVSTLDPSGAELPANLTP